MPRPLGRSSIRWKFPLVRNQIDGRDIAPLNSDEALMNEMVHTDQTRAKIELP